MGKFGWYNQTAAAGSGLRAGEMEMGSAESIPAVILVNVRPVVTVIGVVGAAAAHLAEVVPKHEHALLQTMVKTTVAVQVNRKTAPRRPVVIPTVGAGGTTTPVAVASLVAGGVGITVIAPIIVERVRTVTIITAGTVTRTMGTPHSVVNALLPAIGTTPVIAVGMAIAVVPSTKNAMYLIQTGSVAAPVPTRM